MSGILFIVSAPSGGGKTTLVKALLAVEPEVRLSVSYTTRPPRPGEVNGRDYHFVSPARFESMLKAGEFLENAVIYGNHYGTSEKWIAAQLKQDRDIVLEIDWQGAQLVRRLMSETVSVFILPPSLEALERRLNTRSQDSAEVIARRLAAAREEIGHVGEFDYVIMNEDLNRAAQELVSIIRAERLKLSRQVARHADLINRMK
ncbi:MAG: guanylate kinase [Betaproteobacteria bacterium]|nr:guanylate kinase [Betaproteobacteria bacterium]